MATASRTPTLPDALARLQAGITDRYRLGRELGRGGMATVYLAQDLKHDRPVAIKVLRHGLGSLFGPERFQREIRLAAQLQHPNILPVYDSGATDGVLWYTMPFVEGDTLRGRLRHRGGSPSLTPCPCSRTSRAHWPTPTGAGWSTAT